MNGVNGHEWSEWSVPRYHWTMLDFSTLYWRCRDIQKALNPGHEYLHGISLFILCCRKNELDRYSIRHLVAELLNYIARKRDEKGET